MRITNSPPIAPDAPPCEQAPPEHDQSYVELIARGKKLNYDEPHLGFVKRIYSELDSGKLRYPRGHSKAALFDLAVTARYLHINRKPRWYICKNDGNYRKVHPFVNACPCCTLRRDPRHVEGNKPTSAQIGATTSNILVAFLDLEANHTNENRYDVRIIEDNGMVDAYLKSNDTKDNLLLLFEIKSAPLLSFPVVTDYLNQTDNNGPTSPPGATSTPQQNHESCTDTPTEESLMIIGEKLHIPLGAPKGFAQGTHYDRIYSWLTQNDNLNLLIGEWLDIYQGYADPSARKDTFWLTNGCGSPSHATIWPNRSRGSGKQQISDAKSSVGMDRTDDLKKGIYQVLKMSTHYKEFFPHPGHEVFTAIASNIHAVKHHENYLSELLDISWTINSPSRNYVTEHDDHHLIEKGKLYNLFDGIITFTESEYRSDRIEAIFENDNR